MVNAKCHPVWLIWKKPLHYYSTWLNCHSNWLIPTNGLQASIFAQLGRKQLQNQPFYKFPNLVHQKQENLPSPLHIWSFPSYLVSKQVLVRNLSYEIVFKCFTWKWTWRRNTFSHEWFRTRFDTEKKQLGNGLFFHAFYFLLFPFAWGPTIQTGNLS